MSRRLPQGHVPAYNDPPDSSTDPPEFRGDANNPNLPFLGGRGGGVEGGGFEGSSGAGYREVWERRRNEIDRLGRPVIDPHKKGRSEAEMAMAGSSASSSSPAAAALDPKRGRHAAAHGPRANPESTVPTYASSSSLTSTSMLMSGLSQSLQGVGLGGVSGQLKEANQASSSATVVTSSTQASSSVTAPSLASTVVSGLTSTESLWAPVGPMGVSSVEQGKGGGGGSSTTASVVATAAPIFPLNASDSPKTALHRLYGKPPRRKVLSADDYYTWNDNGPTHALKWTSVFLCPLTGEPFPSGRYGDPTSYTVVPCPLPGSDVSDPYVHEVVWYSKKTNAEHGSACRALDCLLARDSNLGIWSAPTTHMGRDAPHLQPDLSIPPFVPIQLQVIMQQRQSQIRQGGSVGG